MKISVSDVKMAILEFIHDTGRAPTVRDIAYRLDVRSYSNVHRYVVELRRDGFLIQARNNERDTLWPAELHEAIRDSARYMAGQMKRR